ncbi:MAG: hypothetical protein KGZ58_05825 [Ignavibacteriales bacterium]|nr:hypothetical protein [Ignavibacteriales bacterium]
MKIQRLFFFSIVILFSGCLRSLRPLYTDKDLVFDKALIGVWSEENERDTWTFLKSEKNSYELVYTEKGVPAKLEAHLVQLGSYRFLDIYLKDIPEENGLYNLHIIPAHTFSKVRFHGDTLSLSMLDADWAKKMFKENKLTIKHEETEKGLLLTAPTEDLQKLVLTYAEDKNAFGKESVLIRRK